MTRSIVLMASLVAAACAGVGADDKDPVKEKLFAAKVAYDKEMAQFRTTAGEWFDKREEAARKAGDKKALDQVKAEQKAFDETGDLPKAVPAAMRQKPILAKKALEAAYSQAVKDYVKAKKDAEAAAVETEWMTFANGTTIAPGTSVDLLALVDTKAHTVSGEWKKDKKLLVGAASGNKQAKLQLRYEPGEEYDLEVKCKRGAGADCLCFGLVAGGRQVLSAFDLSPELGFRSGLDMVDMKHVSDNVTAVKGEWLKAGKDHTIKCLVRSEKIDISVDGQAAISFKGEFTRLSLNEEHGVPNNKALFLLVGPATSFQFDRIVVTPIKGKGTILK